MLDLPSYSNPSLPLSIFSTPSSVIAGVHQGPVDSDHSSGLGVLWKKQINHVITLEILIEPEWAQSMDFRRSLSPVIVGVLAIPYNSGHHRRI
jgi:hypothetical protein